VGSCRPELPPSCADAVDAAIKEARLAAVRNKVRLDVSGARPAFDFTYREELSRRSNDSGGILEITTFIFPSLGRILYFRTVIIRLIIRLYLKPRTVFHVKNKLIFKHYYRIRIFLNCVYCFEYFKTGYRTLFCISWIGVGCYRSA